MENLIKISETIRKNILVHIYTMVLFNILNIISKNSPIISNITKIILFSSIIIFINIIINSIKLMKIFEELQLQSVLSDTEFIEPKNNAIIYVFLYIVTFILFYVNWWILAYILIAFIVYIYYSYYTFLDENIKKIIKKKNKRNDLYIISFSFKHSGGVLWDSNNGAQIDYNELIISNKVKNMLADLEKKYIRSLNLSPLDPPPWSKKEALQFYKDSYYTYTLLKNELRDNYKINYLVKKEVPKDYDQNIFVMNFFFKKNECCLWALNEKTANTFGVCCINNTLPLSQNLKNTLNHLQTTYDSMSEIIEYLDNDLKNSFENDCKKVWSLLKKELGKDFIIIYDVYFPFEKK